MSYWQGVRFLVQQDMKNARWKNLTFLILVMYVVLFSFTTFTETVIEGLKAESLLAEYLLLIMFSGIGLIATHLYSLGDMKRDLLAERLIYWRTLPIKQDQIVWSRIIGVFFYLIVSVILFYGSISIALVLTDVSFNFVDIMLHGLQFLAIALVLNFVFLYCEMVFSLKIYSIICWTYPFVFLILVVLYFVVGDYSLLEAMDILAKQQPLLTSIGSIVVMVGSLWLAHKMITPKFRKRNI